MKDFSSFQKNVSIDTIFEFLFSTRFNSITCNLRLDEHIAKMYVSIDIASFGRHVIYKNHI